MVALLAALTFVELHVGIFVNAQHDFFVGGGGIGLPAVGADFPHQPLGHHAPEGAGDEPRLHADVPQTGDGGDGGVTPAA